MADRFERSIQDWYQNSRTASLEFLNLENYTKPNLADLSNNISVPYAKLLLHSKISIKHFHQSQDILAQQTELIEEQLRKIEHTQSKLLESIHTLEDEILTKQPLTREEVFSLVNEIAQQPKKVEQEALRVSTKLEAQQEQLLEFISDLKRTISG